MVDKVSKWYTSKISIAVDRSHPLLNFRKFNQFINYKDLLPDVDFSGRVKCRIVGIKKYNSDNIIRVVIKCKDQDALMMLKLSHD